MIEVLLIINIMLYFIVQEICYVCRRSAYPRCCGYYCRDECCLTNLSSHLDK